MHTPRIPASIAPLVVLIMVGAASAARQAGKTARIPAEGIRSGMTVSRTTPSEGHVRGNEPKPRPLPAAYNKITPASWKTHVDEDLVFMNPLTDYLDSENCTPAKKISVVVSPVIGAMELARKDFIGNGQVVAKIENTDPNCGIKDYHIPKKTTGYLVVQGANDRKRRSFIMLEGSAKRVATFLFMFCDDNHPNSKSAVVLNKGCDREKPTTRSHIPIWISCANGCCYNEDTRRSSSSSDAASLTSSSAPRRRSPSSS
jgi:hypothetical protein